LPEPDRNGNAAAVWGHLFPLLLWWCSSPAGCCAPYSADCFGSVPRVLAGVLAWASSPTCCPSSGLGAASVHSCSHAGGIDFPLMDRPASWLGGFGGGPGGGFGAAALVGVRRGRAVVSAAAWWRRALRPRGLVILIGRLIRPAAATHWRPRNVAPQCSASTPSKRPRTLEMRTPVSPFPPSNRVTPLHSF